MENIVNVDEFVKKWCDLIGDADKTDEELAEAFAHALNRVYQHGVRDGMNRTGAIEIYENELRISIDALELMTDEEKERLREIAKNVSERRKAGASHGTN